MAKSQVHVTFFMKAVQDKKASKDAGRPVHKDVEYVRIRYPGDTKQTLEQPAHTSHALDRTSGRYLTYAESFPEHYEQFKRGIAEQVVGTPLSELPFLTEAQRADIRAQAIHTGEQLAAMTRQAVKKFGTNGPEWKQQAEAYLKKAEGSADVTKLAAENAAMQEQMQALMAELDAMRKEQAA